VSPLILPREVFIDVSWFFSINFANEKLQQHFTYYILEMEQQEYQKEGVKFEQIAYEDNRDSIDLVEGKLGIFQYIEEEGLVPKGTDATLLAKLGNTFGSHKRFEVSKKVAQGFCIKHYAGPVHYSVDGFVSKNKDTFQPSLSNCLTASSLSIMKSIFEEDTSQGGESNPNDKNATIRSRNAPLSESTGTVKGGKKGGKVRSVGTTVSAPTFA
jgi:myosin heavy subunit